MPEISVMKKIIVACLPVVLLLSVGNAQITLTDADMPHAGDSARYSVANQAFLLQAGSSGPNRMWDFSDLTSSSQYVNNFQTVSSTAFTYQLVFTLGPSASNVAMADPNGINIPSQTGVSLTDVYNFYKRSSSEFSQTGFGASVQGFPLPVAYSSKDKLYPLPLDYQSQSTSNYRYQIDIPTLGYYGRVAERINEVDAYGTLKLPFGTFEVLRLKSILKATDSLALDTFNLGFNIPYPDEIHYKYVAKNYGWPLLEITASDIFGLEVVTRAVYRDTLKKSSIGFSELPYSSINIYPNPATELVMIKSELLKTSDITYTLFDGCGRKIIEQFRSNQRPGTCIEALHLNSMNLSNGMYFIKIQTGDSKSSIHPLLVNNH
jgi:hypothetical protein